MSGGSLAEAGRAWTLVTVDTAAVDRHFKPDRATDEQDEIVEQKYSPRANCEQA